MMWLESGKVHNLDDSDDSDSVSSGEEIPIWVRGEQRFVSGISEETTCQDVIHVLLQDEEIRGRPIAAPDQYHITERWRGVEQPLDPFSHILDIWNAWGTAQTEVKISLRRIKNDGRSRRPRCKSDCSQWSDKSAWKTIHPKRLHQMQNEKQPSSTEELLKLVLAQGEVIKRQLRKLRHSEHQIGCLEDKTHRARIRKHGSNYLLETYLKSLSEAVEPDAETLGVDKNSDSGVMTEGDSEQSNPNNKTTRTAEDFGRLSPTSEDFNKELKDDDTSSTVSEATVREQVELLEKIAKLNKRLLREEERLVRLDANLRKYDKNKPNENEEITKTLCKIRTDMTKSACEMQHNEIVLEETMDMLEKRRNFLDNLYSDLLHEDQEYEMLQALLYSSTPQKSNKDCAPRNLYHTKELLDTLV
ncbi:ras association domain-containing protein 10 [Aethina tumida]|uniref:ras association domain-containing protein 10 n=1 Tax=Aethina tumida TaxID=116153 RepID=UPI00096B64D0|nr:ras association domain-containing protein 10 [Aethina tumida]XP_049826017.1 ras association domain-containing protein 10 [Aethina tumida]XP_049826018.1 ras association domain-containing protein 10 [Aethina tumida]